MSLRCENCNANVVNRFYMLSKNDDTIYCHKCFVIKKRELKK